MPIYINVDKTASGLPEWAIIEIQGIVHSRGEVPFSGLVAGDLHYVERSHQPVLVLGHHVLHGKETRLDQPFAVIEKIRTEEGTRYETRALVKKKLVFKTRPKPIISNVAERV